MQYHSLAELAPLLRPLGRTLPLGDTLYTLTGPAAAWSCTSTAPRFWRS